MAAWATSGLSCKEYAAKAKVNPRTLAWWKSKLGTTATPAFVEVTGQAAAAAPPEAGVLELLVGRVLLRVRGRVDADALTREQLADLAELLVEVMLRECASLRLDAELQPCCLHQYWILGKLR